MFFLLKQVVSEKVGKLLVEVGAVWWLIWIKTVCGKWKVLVLEPRKFPLILVWSVVNVTKVCE